MKRFRIVPLELINRTSGLSIKKLRKVSIILNERGLVNYITAPYEGLALTTVGLDTLALKSLTSLNIVSRFGKKIGTGKESDIYCALDPDGNDICLKFYRIGRVSFKDVIRKRNYVTKYVPWLLRSVEAASREFKVLRKLYNRGVSVPRPIACSWHVVVMEFLGGEIVARAKQVKNPDIVLEETLKIVRDAYKNGYVNGDLSAYNVFVTTDERVLIIDWPQAIRKTQRNALNKLKEDIERLCKYFNKRFNLDYDCNNLLRKIVL